VPPAPLLIACSENRLDIAASECIEVQGFAVARSREDEARLWVACGGMKFSEDFLESGNDRNGRPAALRLGGLHMAAPHGSLDVDGLAKPSAKVQSGKQRSRAPSSFDELKKAYTTFLERQKGQWFQSIRTTKSDSVSSSPSVE
jgi:hypothetical protein